MNGENIAEVLADVKYGAEHYGGQEAVQHVEAAESELEAYREAYEAAKELLNACYDADIRYGLPEEVDGSYLDSMRKAIAKVEGRE